MSFLFQQNSENLATRITNKGRKKIAQGNFHISYFQIGDSEFDYTFSEFNGTTNLAQKVLIPLDKDNQVKYPFKASSTNPTLTGVTYGIPIQSARTQLVTNDMGSAGFCTTYDDMLIVSTFVTVDISVVNGTSTLVVPSGSTFNIDQFITIFFSRLGGSGEISGNTLSMVYRIIGINGNDLSLDRNMPNFSSLAPRSISVIVNDYFPQSMLVCCQQDSWTLNTIWSQNPAGLDPLNDAIAEKLSGYTSNVFVSTKEYFGYNTSSGQTSNTGTTIVNGFGETIIVSPEEQHSLSLLRYPRDIDIYANHDLGFKYEDYIDHTASGVDEFEIFIPFILYDRNSTANIGARFHMDSVDYFINSSAIDTRNNQMKFRYLLDEQNNRVGKIFVNHKVIIFDDQEIVATLDYKSNRRYTLPIPKISTVPVDSKCDVWGDVERPVLTGSTGQTIFVTYLLSGSTSNTLHCNHYSKIQGGSVNSDVAVTFSETDFKFMVTGETINGYSASKFYILAQQVETGNQPDPMGWKMMDYTSEFVLTSGYIDPADLRGTRFIISYIDYETDSVPYVMDDPDVFDTTISPEFGDEQPFPGSIVLRRATDLEVMSYKINLPSGYFETSQNPSFAEAKRLHPSLNPRITEIALLDENKDVMVITKMSNPIERIGSQVPEVEIDI